MTARRANTVEGGSTIRHLIGQPLTVGGVVCFGAALVSIELSHAVGDVAIVWLANAVLLAALLWANRQSYALLLAAGAVASLAANIATGHGVVASLIVSVANLLEVFAGAVLIRRWAGPLPLFNRVAGVVRFSLVAGLAAPALGATLAAAGLTLLGSSFVDVWRRWFIGDALGALIITPMLLIGCNLMRKEADPTLADRSLPRARVAGAGNHRHATSRACGRSR